MAHWQEGYWDAQYAQAQNALAWKDLGWEEKHARKKEMQRLFYFKDWDRARKHIALGIDPRQCAKSDGSPYLSGELLGFAASWAPADIVGLLLDSGALPDDPAGLGGETALMMAAKADNAQAAGVLLAAGASLEQADKMGFDAISCAAMSGGAQALRILMEAARSRGLDPLALPLRKVPPLCAACYGGSPQAARLLLEAGADPNGACHWGNPPILRCANFPGPDDVKFEIMALLLEAGADPSMPNPKGESAAGSGSEAVRGFLEAWREAKCLGSCGPGGKIAKLRAPL